MVKSPPERKATDRYAALYKNTLIKELNDRIRKI